MSQSPNQAPPNVIYVTDAKPSKPQSISTAAGGIIFLSAGMNMALGLGWFQYSVAGSAKHFCYSWFIGVIIGSILTAPLINYIPKKFIMALSTLLILIGGILFTSCPHSYDTLLAGRYFNGIAIGLAIVPFLVNASGIAAPSNRGSCCVQEQYGITLGLTVQMIYASFWSISMNFPINCLHGIMDIIFAILAGIFLIYFVESALDYIRKGEDVTALETIGRLRHPRGVNMEVRALFEQHKSYVREQDSLSMAESLCAGLVPLVKMIFFRSMMLVFSYSLPLNAALQFSVIMDGNTWAPTVGGCARTLGAIIALCLVDKVARKIPSILSAVIVGAMLIGIGLIFRKTENILITNEMTTVMCLYIIAQAFAGFFAPYTSVYLGEAFPLRVKPYLMAVCVIVEQILQIVLIQTSSQYLGTSLLVQGSIVVIAFLLLSLSMPETRRTSLAEAQRRFNKLFYIKLAIEV